VSTLSRKARADLTRHPARSMLTMATLSIAIASLGFLAVPSMLNGAMNRQVQLSHLNELGIYTSVIDLTPAQLAALGHLPGVAAVSPVLGYTAEATSAAGVQNVAIAGGDLASAAVNTVPLLSGRSPGPGEVLADAGNARATDYAVPVGGTIRVRAADGRFTALRVSGTGLNLAATPGANGSTTPVFYATLATVDALSGHRGYDYLGFRLTDDSPFMQSRVFGEARAYLIRQTGRDPMTSLPYMRAAGQWPGQSAFAHDIALLYIITILALVSALFLMSATMNTLIAEQSSEVAILKTLGGRRRQIAGIVVRTAAMLGAAGAVIGTILGIVIAYLLTRYFAVKLVDVSFGFSISAVVVVVSLLAGPVIAVGASMPALRRALRRPVVEALAGKDPSGYGAARLDRLAARSGLLSAAAVPGSVRMGMRNALRQKRRSAATIAQVAVASGLAVSLIALGQSVTALISQTVGTLHFDIGVGMAAGRGVRPFGSQAIAIARRTPGVTGAEPHEASSVQYNGQTYVAWGMGARPLYSYRLSAGHWFTTADVSARAGGASTPVVLGPAVARAMRATVGRVLLLSVATGSVRVRVIGIDTVPTNGGNTVYFPLPTLERLDGGPGTAHSIWVSTASTTHGAIDAVAASLARRLDSAGYAVTTSKIYVIEAQITAAERSVLTIVEILGLFVVAIMLMGLVSSLSMGVFERTREIGILRCVGGRARHIRRVFSTEAAALAVVGWAFGVLLGWLIYRVLLVAIRSSLQLSLPEEFLPVIPFGVLAGVLVLTLLVIRGPLGRATRIQPGTALRYQ
jgi:putative ABC transport system permease protein